MEPKQSVLLVCTVGGSSEPVLAAIRHWQPVRVRFVHTSQTKADINGTIVPAATERGLDLAGRYDTIELEDGQDLGACIERLRSLNAVVDEWTGRGPPHAVVVDFTGGTKCMSAALALQARQWPCSYSYVGGTARTKEGVGIVVTGTESIVHQVNPWDALGHQAVEDFIVLFDQRAFTAAAGAAGDAKMRMARGDRKRELQVLEELAKGFDSWDRFDHRTAVAHFKHVARGANDLREVVGRDRADTVLGILRATVLHLEQLVAAPPPSRYHVLDLLANARRRRDERRGDDVVARLYRAIEALGQVALRDHHQIDDTSTVPIEKVPEALRVSWTKRAQGGMVRLGLQEVYELLFELGNELGERFRRAKLHEKTSALGPRNRSILAHGFERVSDGAVTQLWTATLGLVEVEETELPAFPTLGRRAG